MSTKAVRRKNGLTREQQCLEWKSRQWAQRW
jgi:hypothetical protein